MPLIAPIVARGFFQNFILINASLTHTVLTKDNHSIQMYAFVLTLFINKHTLFVGVDSFSRKVRYVLPEASSVSLGLSKFRRGN